MGEAYACYYQRKMRSTTLSHIQTNDEEAIVNVVRTESMNRAAKMVNNKRIAYPRHPELPVLKEHLRAMKKVKSYNESGEEVVNWVNTGPDHYAHALNYMIIASELAADSTASEGYPTPASINTVQQRVADGLVDVTSIRV